MKKGIIHNRLQKTQSVLSGFGLQKARSGIYADTAENRSLNRVGQKYGTPGKGEEEKKGRKPAKAEDPTGGKKAKPEEGGSKKPKGQEQSGGQKPQPQQGQKKPAGQSPVSSHDIAQLTHIKSILTSDPVKAYEMYTKLSPEAQSVIPQDVVNNMVKEAHTEEIEEAPSWDDIGKKSEEGGEKKEASKESPKEEEGEEDKLDIPPPESISTSDEAYELYAKLSKDWDKERDAIINSTEESKQAYKDFHNRMFSDGGFPSIKQKLDKLRDKYSGKTAPHFQHALTQEHPQVAEALEGTKFKLQTYSKGKGGYFYLDLDTTAIKDDSWNQDEVAKHVKELAKKMPMKMMPNFMGSRGETVGLTFRGKNPDYKSPDEIAANAAAKSSSAHKAVQDWSGEHLKTEWIDTVRDALEDTDITDNDLKIKKTANWTQEKESNAVHDKVEELKRNIMPGAEHKDMDDEDVHDVLWGMVRGAMDGEKFFD